MDITKIFEEENVVMREDYESLYSTDAEGELDDDQERTISEMLASGLTNFLWTVSTNVLICSGFPPCLLYRVPSDRSVVFPVHHVHHRKVLAKRQVQTACHFDFFLSILCSLSYR
jgi:hypothetical protein